MTSRTSWHIVRLKLSNAGLRVLTAADGEEALDLALQHGPRTCW